MQLVSLVTATSELRDHLLLLDSCRYGPASVVQAAVADLEVCVDRVAQAGPAGNLADLITLEQASRGLDDEEVVASLAAMVRANVRRITEQSALLALELRQLLADTRDVVSVATGSAGTYDSHGCTTVGQLRRERGLA
jgi:hypothetical protein